MGLHDADDARIRLSVEGILKRTEENGGETKTRMVREGRMEKEIFEESEGSSGFSVARSISRSSSCMGSQVGRAFYRSLGEATIDQGGPYMIMYVRCMCTDRKMVG